MKNTEELKAWIKLWRISGVGSKKFQLLLSHFGSPQAVFLANATQITQAGVSQKIANAISDEKQNDESTTPDLTWLTASENHHILTLECEEYPERLKQINDAPALLYVHGNLSILQDPQLGVVGSRNPTQSGQNNAYEFSKYLAQTGMCINSGLALGVDGAAHQGAIDGNGPTIAVIATGIDRVYPAKHRALAHQIVKNGAIISEFPVGTHPDSRHFPRRNRIISAMSYGVLVVEAALKSGSLITARLAMEQNREVFAIPGSIHNPLAKGCHQLIRQGAKLVETAEDILEEMSSLIDLNDHQVKQTKTHAVNAPQPSSSKTRDFQLETPQSETPQSETSQLESTQSNLNANDHITNNTQGPSSNDSEQKTAMNELDPEQSALLNAMGFDPISIDQIVLATDLDAASVAAMLLILELQNYVTSNGGGTYTRIK